ncbi:MAG: hypothetical protein M1838_000122 [Thelocarpon superellum]|nr:MAG: hypothetical protein M1838_000122 [Thelocarpon superellum]
MSLNPSRITAAGTLRPGLPLLNLTMPPSKKLLAGPGYVILNILRVMNIVALAAVMVASWVMLVKTFIVSKFFFFDAVSHIITSSISMFLIVSELSLFESYFSRNWPLLSPSSGFVGLGFAMIVVGVSVLGNLNKEATSQESLGLGFWRVVIASGIVVAVLGLLNIIASYVFRDSVLDVTARQVRAHGATAAQTSPRSHSTRSRKTFRSEFMGTRKGSPSSQHSHDRDSRRPLNPKMPLNISKPMNVNAQFKDYVRPSPTPAPETTQHPAYMAVEPYSLQRPDATHPRYGSFVEDV